MGPDVDCETGSSTITCTRPEGAARPRLLISSRTAAASWRLQQYMKPPGRSVISQSTQGISAHTFVHNSLGASEACGSLSPRNAAAVLVV